MPSPDVMLIVQGRPDMLSAEQLIAQIEWPDTTDAQKVKDGEDHSVAEKAEFPPDSTTCELLRRASPTPNHAHQSRTNTDLARLIYATLRRRSILRDEQCFPQKRREDFLHWAAARSVLPEGGLASTEKGKITLRCCYQESEDRWWREAEEDA